MPRRPQATSLLAVAALLVAVVGCGEPAVDLTLPERAPGQHVLDEAGLLEGSVVADRLAALAGEGVDVVAVTYETPQAGLGEGSRAGRLVVEEWDADVALVAVAAPGDFDSTAPDRRRYFGLESADRHAVPRGLRERVAEELAPPLAADNAWVDVFVMAIDELEAELAG